MRTPYAMYVFSPMMQSGPIQAGPRMWTLSHTDVPAPISTPDSTRAVGWMRGAADEEAVEDAGGVAPPLMRRRAPPPAPTLPRAVASLHAARACPSCPPTP